MRANWIISIIVTILIWGAGAYAFYFIYDNVPNDLHAESLIVGTEQINANTTDETQSGELKDIINNTQKLVVKIELADGSLGSGFLYNNKGDIITNAHVVVGAKDVYVKTADAQEFPGRVIGISEETDVAVVRVDSLAGTEPLPLDTEKKAEIGDQVLALGNPLGLENTVTTGIISGIDRDLELPPYIYEDVYQFSAPITNGNSGGPLINQQTGKVIGINSAGTDQGAIGFSIPIINVIGLVESWSETPMTSLPGVDNYLQSYEYDSDTDVWQEKDFAVSLVEQFYEMVNNGDYVTAYSLLGSNWQTEETYDAFRNGYLNTKSVVIDDLAVVTETEPYQVVAIISAEEVYNGTTAFSTYKVTYTIDYENDVMKIVTGEGEVIE